MRTSFVRGKIGPGFAPFRKRPQKINKKTKKKETSHLFSAIVKKTTTTTTTE